MIATCDGPGRDRARNAGAMSVVEADSPTTLLGQSEGKSATGQALITPCCHEPCRRSGQKGISSSNSPSWAGGGDDLSSLTGERGARDSFPPLPPPPVPPPPPPRPPSICISLAMTSVVYRSLPSLSCHLRVRSLP